MFRKLFTGKRLAGVAFIAVLAVTGAAVAYFTGGSGSVTGSGTVGSASALSVTTGTPTWSGSLTALYPGATNNTQFLPVHGDQQRQRPPVGGDDRALGAG